MTTSHIEKLIQGKSVAGRAAPGSQRASERTSQVSRAALKGLLPSGSVEELMRLRDGVSKNRDLQKARRDYLTSRLDRRIAEKKSDARLDADMRRVRATLASNPDYVGRVDSVAKSIEYSVKWLAEYGRISGIDTSPIGPTASRTRPLLSFEREDGRTVKGTIADKGRGSPGPLFELMAIAQLDRGFKASATGRTLELRLEKGDYLDLGWKYFTADVHSRATIEGDWAINRHGRKIAIDTKYRSTQAVSKTPDIVSELRAAVELMAIGRLDHFVLATNGQIAHKLRKEINELNQQLTAKLRSRRDELENRVVKMMKAGKMEFEDALCEKVVVDRVELKLSSQDVSHLLRMRATKEKDSPAIWIAENLSAA